MPQAAVQEEKNAAQLSRIRAEADRLPGADQENPLQPDIPPDRTRQFQHVNFSRMRTDWKPSERIQVQEMGLRADRLLMKCFPEAYALIEELYGIVREPEINSITEEPLRDPAGRIRWKRNDRGLMIEHWDRLGDRQRSELLDRLTVWMFEWEQQAAVMWGSAMFAKGIWEETFAYGYTAPRGSFPNDDTGKLTIDDRTQRGHLHAIEERYFAIYESILSRRAEALVRSLQRLYGRLMKGENS